LLPKLPVVAALVVLVAVLAVLVLVGCLPLLLVGAADGQQVGPR
tara:strand:+ start:542 stop:673 length:132 start_codon:yes stop_codon:yes gene_type:complete